MFIDCLTATLHQTVTVTLHMQLQLHGFCNLFFSFL